MEATRRSNIQWRRGFTLAELMVAVVIIRLTAGMVIAVTVACAILSKLSRGHSVGGSALAASDSLRCASRQLGEPSGEVTLVFASAPAWSFRSG